MVSNETSSALNSEQDLASIPTAQGGLSRNLFRSAVEPIGAKKHLRVTFAAFGTNFPDQQGE